MSTSTWKGRRPTTANPEEMQIVPLHDQGAERSPLAAARLRRQLTVAEAARRAGIGEDEARWLEEGRVYRFRSTDAAMLALLLYATALGIEHREAKELAGLPVPPKPFEPGTRARLAVVAAIAALLAALLTAVAFSQLGDTATLKPLAKQTPAPLPPASKIGALGYSIERVRRAPQQNYARTLVYYEAGGGKVAARLARQLRTTTAPLPGGKNAHRLVVIVGRR